MNCLTIDLPEMKSSSPRHKSLFFNKFSAFESDCTFPLLGMDSDNGGGLINCRMTRYCNQEGITFARSRPYRKNDNRFVEHKNYSVVRRLVSYARYQGKEAVQKELPDPSPETQTQFRPVSGAVGASASEPACGSGS